MKTGIAAIVFCKLLHSVFIDKAGIYNIFIFRRLKFIIIEEIMARIIWWVDVDHLDLAHVRFLQEFQCVQIIALNVEIFSCFPIFTGGGCKGEASY